MPPPSIVLCLGDSLTQTGGGSGWLGQLAHILQRRADVMNRGLSGYNTRWYNHWAMHAPDADVWTFSKNKVVMVTIWLGANDASLPDVSPHAYVPLDEYKRNLHHLIQTARTTYPQARILVLTPPPVHHEQRLDYQIQRYGPDKATGILERTKENTGRYAQACMDLVTKEFDPQEQQVHGIDLYHAMMENNDDDYSKFLSDGLHLSQAGHDFVVQQILNILPPLVTPCPHTGQWNNSGSSSSISFLSSVAPYHDAIDHDDWQRAFDEWNQKKQRDVEDEKE